MDSTMDDDSGQSKTRGANRFSLGYKNGPNDDLIYSSGFDKHSSLQQYCVLRGTRAGREMKEKGDSTKKHSHENGRESFFPSKDDVEGSALLTGDAISLQKATNQRGTFGACHFRLQNPAQPGKYHRLVGSIKENFDFITKGDLVLGDDVEYLIKTGKGKKVACDKTQLSSGSVVFDDVSSEIMRGQMLKPLERSFFLRATRNGLL
ncbi:unnamed protein product [Spodoptera exigua]|nr:unnamed protein product [Spodoptera exigua]CAH0703317.1 unnamed protein product [Spodoptera exigua]CAH0703319.1 unnamed protein product [Spodoptera exigua]CAH0703321.1 unnamed protein product [Spodoptera exigua]